MNNAFDNRVPPVTVQEACRFYLQQNRNKKKKQTKVWKVDSLEQATSGP